MSARCKTLCLFGLFILCILKGFRYSLKIILKRQVKHNTNCLRTQFFIQNGVKIPPDSRTEYAEDMYPTGVRLVVSTVTSYAEYTCKVTNEAGSANVTAYIYAITGKNQCFQSVLMIYFSYTC